MRVNCHGHFHRVGEFDPESGDLTVYERGDAPNLGQPVGGHFAHLAGELVVLFRRPDGQLVLRIGSTEVEVDHSTTVERRVDGGSAELVASRSGRPIATVEYQPQVQDPPLADDPTPFVEEEDTDFGLFVARVTADPARREDLYR